MRAVIAVAFSLVLFHGPAFAAATGFDLRITDSLVYNAARFHLTNTSEKARLERFELTIGDPDYNFDQVFDRAWESPFRQGTVVSPDEAQGVGRSAAIRLIFDENERSGGTFFADIDAGTPLLGRESNPDFAKVFFDNGSDVPNSVARAFFSNGKEASIALPENPDFFTVENGAVRIYEFTAEAPLPGAVWLLGAAVAGLGLYRVRRKAA